MGYGWDFAPRLVRLGILGPVRLRQTGAHRLRDLWARPTLPTDRRASATVALAVRVEGRPARWCASPSAQGRVSGDRRRPTAGADGLARAPWSNWRSPALWWPNGLGGQPLYTADAECADGSDGLATTFGVREVRWVRAARRRGGGMAADAGGQRAAGVPAGVELGARRRLGGPRADRRARRLLRLARAAGANILRCWGGGDPETPAFYDDVRPAGPAGLAGVPAVLGGHQQHAARPTRPTWTGWRLMRRRWSSRGATIPAWRSGAGATS